MAYEEPRDYCNQCTRWLSQQCPPTIVRRFHDEHYPRRTPHAAYFCSESCAEAYVRERHWLRPDQTPPPIPVPPGWRPTHAH